MKVIVVGAGSFGSWCAWNLLANGADVTLIDAWGPGNSRSSSGGETRVIRTVYGTDSHYVELASRAIKLWDSHQRDWQENLMEITGCLWLCGADDSYVRASQSKMQQHGLSLDDIPLSTARTTWPLIEFDGIEQVIREPTAGFLRARKSCEVIKQQFENHGGEFINGNVLDLDETQPIDRVNLSNGNSYEADHYVFACGPWLKDLFPESIGNHMQISRQEVYYFGASKEISHLISELPIWLELNEPIYYGIPSVDSRGFKIARDERGVNFDPTFGDRAPTSSLVQQTRDYLRRRFPKLADSPMIESRTCQYSNTPDGHYIIDRHSPTNAWVVGGGCGHGFKMGPVIGEIVGNAIINQQMPDPMFGLDRLNAASERCTQFDHS